MTDLLRLTWASDNEADQDTLDLLNFVSGLELSDSGWIPQVAQFGMTQVTETMTFYSRGLSHDSLASKIQLLDDWIYRINVSLNATQRRTVWLNARWKTETNTRRAPIFSLTYTVGSSPFGPYVRDDNFISTLVIVIQRGAFWEELTLNNITTATDSVPLISNLGGASIFVNSADQSAISVSGDVSARITKATLGHAFQETDVWAGFRTSRYGDPALFIPTWEAEDGDAVDADTSVAADAAASGGFAMVTTFATVATLTRRMNIRTSQVSISSSIKQQIGVFTVLMRAKVSTGVVRARISTGLSQADLTSRASRINPRISISSTSYKLYEMGTFQNPAMPHKFEADNTIPGSSGILVDAERVSGAGSLSIDCFVLIPIAEGFFKALFNIATDVAAIVRTNPDGSIYTYDNSVVSALPSIDVIDWALPANNESPLVVIASQSSAQVLSTFDRVLISYVRRWKTLRGNE